MAWGGYSPFVQMLGIWTYSRGVNHWTPVECEVFVRLNTKPTNIHVLVQFRTGNIYFKFRHFPGNKLMESGGVWSLCKNKHQTYPKHASIIHDCSWSCSCPHTRSCSSRIIFWPIKNLASFPKSRTVHYTVLDMPINLRSTATTSTILRIYDTHATFSTAAVVDNLILWMIDNFVCPLRSISLQKFNPTAFLNHGFC